MVSARSRTQAAVRAVSGGIFQENYTLVGFNFSVCSDGSHQNTSSAKRYPTIRDVNLS